MKVTNHKTELAQIMEKQKNSTLQEEKVNVAAEEKTDGVTLKISEEARQKYMLEHNMKVMRKQSENAGKHKDEMGKMMTIFRRIANGDIVPWSDEKKLMEYSSELYQAAKNIGAMRKNEDPKKYKSVDDEDDRKENGAVDAQTAVKAIVENVECEVSGDLEF